MIQWTLFILAAYLLGSVPFAFLIGKMRGVDIRQHGSGNVGASNVGRVLGRKWGYGCFLLDVGKGLIPTVAAGFWFGILSLRMQALSELPAVGDQWLWMAVGVAAIMGHVFPVFLGFKGGKGVATSFGALLGMAPFLTFPALAAISVWAVMMRVTRYISVSSMSAAVSLPLWYLVVIAPHDADGGSSTTTFSSQLQAGYPFFIVSALMAILIVWSHRSNIGRLMKGMEPKVGEAMKAHEKGPSSSTEDDPEN